MFVEEDDPVRLSTIIVDIHHAHTAIHRCYKRAPTRALTYLNTRAHCFFLGAMVAFVCFAHLGPTCRIQTMLIVSPPGCYRTFSPISSRYVTGEFRFRRGYNKHNPRQMVKLWAEKEFRNLTRLRQAGIRCPEPVLLRSHVLVMDFVGKDGWAAPKLKEASITETQARELYLSCVNITRNMYVMLVP